MNQQDIESVLNSRLVALNLGLPVAFENVDYSGDKPYISTQIVVISTRNTDVTATKEVTRGKYSLTLVSQTGSGRLLNNTTGESIKTGFPAGLTLIAASGKLIVMKPPEIREGFRDGPDWRVPVIVDYNAY